VLVICLESYDKYLESCLCRGVGIWIFICDIMKSWLHIFVFVHVFKGWYRFFCICILKMFVHMVSIF